MSLIQVPKISHGREFEQGDFHVLEIATKDDTGTPLFSVFQVTGECMKSSIARGPNAVWSLFAIELQGAFRSMSDRLAKIPAIGAPVTHRGRKGVIMAVDRSNPLGAAVEIRDPSGWKLTVPWAECEWA